MATLDEGVLNLQRFIGLLANATRATEQVGDHVDESLRRFAELEGEAEEEGSGLNDRLTEAHSALETGETEALSAITELAQGATDAQQAAADAQEKVERAARDLDETANAVENELEQASGQLTGQGFQPLAQAIDEAQEGMETESHEEEQAFALLVSAVGAFESDAETAWNEGEAELEEATTDLTEGESALETEATEDAHVLEGAAGAVEAACTELEGEVSAIYDVLGLGVEAQGQAWQQAVQVAGHEALTFVTDARQERLDQPAAMVKDEALATLHQEYDAVDAVLTAAAPAVAGLEPLAGELVKCQGLLPQIDALMDALAS